jgi:hypothetical protein
VCGKGHALNTFQILAFHVVVRNRWLPGTGFQRCVWQGAAAPGTGDAHANCLCLRNVHTVYRRFVEDCL